MAAPDEVSVDATTSVTSLAWATTSMMRRASAGTILAVSNPSRTTSRMSPDSKGGSSKVPSDSVMMTCTTRSPRWTSILTPGSGRFV